jgi:hypothetical protein
MSEMGAKLPLNAAQESTEAHNPKIAVVALAQVDLPRIAYLQNYNKREDSYAYASATSAALSIGKVVARACGSGSAPVSSAWGTR